MRLETEDRYPGARQPLETRSKEMFSISVAKERITRESCRHHEKGDYDVQVNRVFYSIHELPDDLHLRTGRGVPPMTVILK